MRSGVWPRTVAELRGCSVSNYAKILPRLPFHFSPCAYYFLITHTPMNKLAEISTMEISSASRQKSCHACVRGKRGCDKRQPTCSRCVEKKIQCVYAKRTYSDAFSEYNLGELDMPWSDYPSFSNPVNSTYGILQGVAGSAPLDIANLSNLDAFMDPFVHFTDNQVRDANDMQLVNVTSDRSGSRWEKEQALTRFDYSPMADLCVCNSHNEAVSTEDLIRNNMNHGRSTIPIQKSISLYRL